MRAVIVATKRPTFTVIERGYFSDGTGRGGNLKRTGKVIEKGQSASKRHASVSPTRDQALESSAAALEGFRTVRSGTATEDGAEEFTEKRVCRRRTPLGNDGEVKHGNAMLQGIKTRGGGERSMEESGPGG